MKITPAIHRPSGRPQPHAFTLSEMMIAVAVFSFVVGAIVAVQIFASRVYILGATKVSATQGARKTMNAIRDRIRSAKNVYVGNYTNGTGFSLIPAGQLQEGNALAIAYTNTASTNYLIYYLDTTQPTNTLYSISNTLTGTLTMEAQYITNYYCFYAEDYNQNILLNYLNNPVFHVVFQFSQWEYPIGFVGTNALNAYDFYNLTTRVMRRAKD
jgi:prepilin-type N-terminal cleavage/methylation domain-containing protein